MSKDTMKRESKMLYNTSGCRSTPLLCLWHNYKRGLCPDSLHYITSPCNLIKTKRRKASCDLGSGTLSVSGHPFLWSWAPVTAFAVTALGEIHEGFTSLNMLPVEWGPVKDKLPMLSFHRHRPLFAMHALAWIWLSRWSVGLEAKILY